MSDCVNAERFEAGDEEEDDDESVVEAEGKMDEDGIGEVVCGVMNFQ